MVTKVTLAMVTTIMVASGCASPRATASPETAPSPASPRPAASAPEDAPADVPLGLSAELETIEANLVDLDFAMRFDIASEGAVASRIIGELRSQGDTLVLRASGSFDGKPVELSLQADGQRLRGTNGTAEISIPQPPELERAVVLGLTRMGLLHNLAMLVGGKPPDRGDGGVDEWVRADDVLAEARIGPGEPGVEAQRSTPSAMSFRIVVAGTEAGEATLWWDSGARLPLERHQVVRFPGGEMRVQERYTIEALRRDG